MKFNFIKETLVFSVVGFFIPGFTAIGILGIQILLSKFGIECSIAWIVIWSLSIVAGIIMPILFCRYIYNLRFIKGLPLSSRLILFNLFEYIFIQASLTPLFTSGYVLCYVSDGQNGLELVFTGWLALPILIIFSFIFDQAFKRNKKNIAFN